MKIYLILLIAIALACCKQRDYTADEKEVKAVVDSFYYALIMDYEKPVSVDTISIDFISPRVAVVNLVDKMGTFFSSDNIRKGKETAITTNRRFLLEKKDGKWIMKENQNTIVNR